MNETKLQRLEKIKKPTTTLQDYVQTIKNTKLWELNFFNNATNIKE